MMGRRRPRLDLAELTALDPTGPADVESATSPHAQALLEKVLAAPPGSDAETAAGSTGPPVGTRWSAPRLALTGAAVVAVAVAVVVLPDLNGGVAGAWTAHPGTLDDAETQAAAEQCRDVWRTSGAGDKPTGAELATMVPLIAEHRGDVDLVVIGNGRWVSSCLLDDSAMLAGLNSPEFVAAEPEPAADGVRWRFAAGSRADDGTWLVAAAGRAGPDVAAITLHPEYAVDGVDVVHATLRDGWFVAFWPNRDDRLAGDPENTPLTLTLRTGEVLRDVVVPWPEES